MNARLDRSAGGVADRGGTNEPTTDDFRGRAVAPNEPIARAANASRRRKTNPTSTGSLQRGRAKRTQRLARDNDATARNEPNEATRAADTRPGRTNPNSAVE